MDKFIEYSPIIIVVLMFFVQQKIFVTIHSFIDLKDQFSEVKDKIDEMYDLLIDLK